MKANSASTCSCSHGSRFALSCNSDSPAASRSICSGVATAAVPAVRVWRAGPTVSWVARATLQGFDPCGEIVRLYGAPLEFNYSGHCLALLGRYGARRDRGDNGTRSGDGIGRVEMGGNDSRMARPLASGQHLFRTRAAAAISPFWAAASTACNTAWAPSALAGQALPEPSSVSLFGKHPSYGI